MGFCVIKWQIGIHLGFLPPMILTGRKISDLNNSRTPVTVIPMRRNGSITIQTKGYNRSASTAIGQQRINKIHHNKKLDILTSEFWSKYIKSVSYL